MEQPDLRAVREWANAKLATGEEPPWAWYQYMKLREVLDTILSGMDAVMPLGEGSPQLEKRVGKHLQPVDSTDPQDNAQLRSSEVPVLLPM